MRWRSSPRVALSVQFTCKNKFEPWYIRMQFPQICNPLKKPSLQSKHRLWAKVGDFYQPSNYKLIRETSDMGYVLPYKVSLVHSHYLHQMGCWVLFTWFANDSVTFTIPGINEFFQTGWRIGFVSPIFHPKAPGSKLSILEWLTYWFATAMGMVGTQLPPKVGIYNAKTALLLVYRMLMAQWYRFLNLSCILVTCKWTSAGANPRLNPQWGFDPNRIGKEQTRVRTYGYLWHLLLTVVSLLAPEGAAVDELDICSGTGSLNTNGEPRNRPRTGFKKASIRGWVAQAQPTTIRPINEDDIEVERPLDIEAEWPDHILFEAGRVHGEWMIKSWFGVLRNTYIHTS